MTSEYYGSGPVAEAAAAFEAHKAELRRREAEQRDRLRKTTRLSDELVAVFNRIGDLLVRAYLMLCGYYQHACGSWRKRRGKPS